MSSRAHLLLMSAVRLAMVVWWGLCVGTISGALIRSIPADWFKYGTAAPIVMLDALEGLCFGTVIAVAVPVVLRWIIVGRVFFRRRD